MSRTNEMMKCNAELVEWCEIVAAEINELASTMNDVERLVDVVGETSAAIGELSKAIETAKKAMRNTQTGTLTGHQWAAMITTTQRTTLDQSKARAMLGDNAPMRTTDVTSVKFGGLF